MNNLKLNITHILAAVFLLTFFTSCDEVGDINTGGTSAQSLAGDWFINVYGIDGIVLSEHTAFSTYNTAANDNTFWLTHGAFKKFKVKAVFTKEGTFTATSSTNIYDNKTLNITDGKVEKAAATSKGGHKVDKISFKVEFSDEPGKSYSYEGSKRTGFSEDEY